MAGFWKAPRALARMLADRELTPNEYALVNLAGQSGGDRDGFVTTIGTLAAMLAVDERTVRRALRGLRAKGWVAYDDHPGIATFVVRMTPEMAALEAATSDTPRTHLGHTSDRARTPPADSTSDTPSAAKTRKPASAKGRRQVGTSDTSRARARGDGDGDGYSVGDELSLVPTDERRTGKNLPVHDAEVALVGEVVDDAHTPGQLAVAHFVDYCGRQGVKTASADRARVGQQAKKLSGEKFTADQIARAIELMVDLNFGAGALPALIREIQHGPRRKQPEHMADRLRRIRREELGQ